MVGAHQDRLDCLCLLDPMGGGHYKWPLRATFCSAVFVTNSYSIQC